MDINLWHRRCAHHSHATITKLIQGDLVSGLIVSSKSQPDPICEACLAGKMTSGPFPSSDSISDHPLELVHCDLHGPLPVATAEGYRYWMTFIDDCTKLQAVMYLRRKSDAFEAYFFFFFFFFFKSGPCAPIYYAVLEHNPRATLLVTIVLHYWYHLITRCP